MQSYREALTWEFRGCHIVLVQLVQGDDTNQLAQVALGNPALLCFGGGVLICNSTKMTVMIVVRSIDST